MATSRVGRLTDALYEIQNNALDIEASAIVSVDGLIIASALPSETGEDRVAAMSAAMLSLGERIAQELGRGNLEQVYVKGDRGYVLLMSVGEEAVLTVLARASAKLGLVFLEMRRAVDSLTGLL
jgi:predicted regulator of Ras-like GTPase activity (Roadblock/LC7/MglB family)